MGKPCLNTSEHTVYQTHYRIYILDNRKTEVTVEILPNRKGEKVVARWG